MLYLANTSSAFNGYTNAKENASTAVNAKESLFDSAHTIMISTMV